MSPASWFLVLPSLAGLGWHASALLRGGSTAWHAAGCALAAAVLVFVFRRGEAPAGRRDTLAACAAALAFWSALLEALLQRTALDAFGAVCLLAGVCFQLAWARRGSDPVLRRGTGYLLIGVALFGGMRTALGRVLPPPSYEPLADAGSPTDALYRGDDGRVHATAGFRGTYVHPDFAGIRVEVNDLGLRDGLDESAPPGPDERSVLVLGDSLAWGIGVPLEDTFQELLERRAAEIDPHPLRVYCAGIPGYGPAQSGAMLRELAPTVRPDVVVLTLFEDDDLQESLYAERTADESGATTASDAGAASALRSLVERALAPAFWRPLATANRRGANPWLARAGLRDVRARPNAFLDLCLRVPEPETVTEARTAALRQVAGIRATCDELGAELIVLLAPAAIQVERDRFESFVSRQPPVPGRHFDRLACHRELAAALAAAGVRVVDMLPPLEAASRAGVTSYHDEGHWNEHGHAAAAAALLPALAAPTDR